MLLWVNLFAEPVVQQEQFYSQASQDQFVYLLLYGLLDKQDDGFYVEIGAGHPWDGNNTYVFEKNLEWKGISLDIVDRRNLWYSTRQNTLLIQDATQADYQSILQPFPKVIDYLSLDIDNYYDTVLQRIPFNDYFFKIITIEHDFYRLGGELREKERKILTALGYYLLCADVSSMDLVFEDWWIHPCLFPAEVFSKLILLDLNGKNHDQLIKIILDSQHRLSKPRSNS
jgi:hypothetical protein